MKSGWYHVLISIGHLLATAFADYQDIYNTKLATSDLQWDKHSRTTEGGWEEVSSFDGNYRSTIRSYQVCDKTSPNPDNWIRSPFVSTRGGKQIYLEVEYSITRCGDEEGPDKSSCKETFNIFYYEATSHVASSTFPPWQEHPYTKVDTVAANRVGGMNRKTFSFGPISRKGFYIAVQDQGACMSLISLRAYYYYCPETTKDLVDYPRTVSESGVASLATASGMCTANAVSLGENEPQYRCSSDGQWQIPTGKCQCREGFEPNTINTDCTRCLANTFKMSVGNMPCVPCPLNSGHGNGSYGTYWATDRDMCPCHPGFARAPNEEIDVPCARPPSQPLNVLVTHSNATVAFLRWTAPVENGGRRDVFFLFTCQVALVPVKDSVWDPCDAAVEYMAPSADKKFTQTFIQLSHLKPFRKYRLTVHSRNGAFADLGENIYSSSSSVEFKTNQAAPTAVKNVKVKRQSSISAHVSWDQPEQTNGVLLTYEVELWPSSDGGVSLKTNEHIPNSILRQTKQEQMEFLSLSQNTGYLLRVRAKTSAGFGPYSPDVSIEPQSLVPSLSSKDQQPPLSLILVIVVLGILLIALGIAISFRYRKTGKLLCLKTTRRRKPQKEQQQLLNGIPLQDSFQERLIVDLPPRGHRIYVEYPDPHTAITELGFEINPKFVKTGQIIGSGEFAEVCKGEIMVPNNSVVDVAVKRLKEGSSAKDQMNFLREASTMAQFNHPNIISLKGVVTKSEPVMIITEFMQNKSLDGYLRAYQAKLTIIQLVKMLEGIASGMSYLSAMKFVHRDLAARNILVDQNQNCKVSDFGLSRALEDNPHATYTTQGGKIAIRWTALESILYRKFTSASDVWSYGIVMWEVTSYGEKPYWDMSNDDVIKNLQDGMRLPAPVGCPKVLHEMMISCWLAESQARPTFSKIAGNLESLLRQPSLLVPDVAREAAALSNYSSNLNTPNINRAFENGSTLTVDKWLEMQQLETYSNQFRKRGVDSLEKVCNLSMNDFKSMGIDISLHMNKLESGIRTLRRHLSSDSTTSSPFHSNSVSLRSTPSESLSREQNGSLTMTPQRSVLV